MAEQQESSSLQQQHDPFTFVVGMCFACIVMASAHGYFALGAGREMGPSMKVFAALSLYVLPGLAAGFVWARWWGLLIGAGIGAAVRVLSLINLGFILPFVEGGHPFSFDAAVEATSPVGLYLLAAVAAGVVAGAAGWALATGGPDRSWFRWLRKLGVGIQFLGFLLAAGAWLYGFLPLGGRRGFEGEYMSGLVAKLHAPVTITLWVGLALTACALLLALGGLAAGAAGGTDEEQR